MNKHYDVVVLGMGLGPLLTAALLSRRSWRVLVLGQAERPPSYSFDGIPLSRRAFTLLFGASPVWLRALGELAQTMTFRRMTRPLAPMFQVLGDGLRLEVPPDVEQFGAEIDREFSGVRRATDDLYAELGRVNGEADAAFERDVVWPPGTFWETRATRRALVDVRLAETPTRDLMADFPASHKLRRVVQETARHGTDATQLPAFALARAHGSLTRGVLSLDGGEADLTEFLVGRIRAQGGEVRPADRAVSIVQRGGKVRAVELDGQAEPVGVNFLVSGGTLQELLRLAPTFPVPRRLADAYVELLAEEQRYCVSLLVRDEALPPPLGVESFVLGEPSRAELSVHLQRRPGPLPGTTSLLAEALLTDATPRVAKAREAVLGTLASQLPFLERHVLLCDSPHDGRPLWDLRGGQRVEVDRLHLRQGGGSVEAEPMVPRYRVAGAELFGLSAEPLRAPLAGAFLCGRSVLPSLGQEGELLAATSVAKIITRTDSQKEKMRREMWSKVEMS
ncbi:MAG TPA: phytoene dehydrogenase [Polyangiaceae bacterium]|nr:phytoene dehydrogenase [Polyangiaceae bacterium]